eukprot:scaffold967_cov173-Ochromonas_danica.AAC.1
MQRGEATLETRNVGVCAIVQQSCQAIYPPFDREGVQGSETILVLYIQFGALGNEKRHEKLPRGSGRAP